MTIAVSSVARKKAYFHEQEGKTKTVLVTLSDTIFKLSQAFDGLSVQTVSYKAHSFLNVFKTHYC